MKFDVIVGNPPYQLSDGGFGKSAKPIYHAFVEQAKKLNPRYLSMIIPARWYNGGKGLSEFRASMLNDKSIKEIHDFPDTSDCFPGINIRGGVCYFLWEKDHNGNCNITNHKAGVVGETVSRPLLEDGLDIFIRYNEAISIYHKVKKFKEESFNKIVSSRKPFGLPTNFKGFAKEKDNKNNILIHRFGDNGYINISKIEKNKEFVNDWKVFVPKASPGDDSYPHLILSKPIVSGPNTCSTETYILIGPVANEKRAKNLAQYMVSSFFRFMVLLAKSTQDVTNKTYALVPMQDFDKTWTDEVLYAKYGISDKEQAFIDTLIRKMEHKYV
jgi:site-specific DNA-methyltransferase (adenine-specific)